jgi:hypothetical protein
MRTALGFDTILQKKSKNAEKNGKIAILFINNSITTFATMKGGEEYGSFR